MRVSLKALSEGTALPDPGKLFTAATSLIVNEVGPLREEVMSRIVDAVVEDAETSKGVTGVGPHHSLLPLQLIWACP